MALEMDTCDSNTLDLLFDELDPVLKDDARDWKNDAWDFFTDDLIKDFIQDDFKIAFESDCPGNSFLSDDVPTDYESSSSVTSTNSSKCASETALSIPVNSELLSTPINPPEINEPNTSPLSLTECTVYVDVNTEPYNLSESGIIDCLDTVKNRDSFIILPLLYEEEVVANEDDICFTENANGKVELNLEEKRLFEKEGFTLPSYYPLTKEEEKNLKKIRRKIRNKVSAQDSRKRKKEYMYGLESRVKFCTTQNEQLHKKVKQLETQNKTLISELRKLQSLLGNYGNKNAHTSTCILVLVLSFALILTPNIWPSKIQNTTFPPSSSGPSRALLSSNSVQVPAEENVPALSNAEIKTNLEGKANFDNGLLKRFHVQQKHMRSLLSEETVHPPDNSSTENQMLEMAVNVPQFL